MGRQILCRCLRCWWCGWKVCSGSVRTCMFCEPNFALLNFLYLLPSVGELATWVHVCIDRIYCHNLDDASNSSGHDLSVRLDCRASFHIQSRVWGTGSAACGPRLTAAEKIIVRTETRNKQLKGNKCNIQVQKYISYCSLQEHSVSCPLQTAPLLSCSCSVSRWGKVLQAADWLSELVHGVRVQELQAVIWTAEVVRTSQTCAFGIESALCVHEELLG